MVQGSVSTKLMPPTFEKRKMTPQQPGNDPTIWNDFSFGCNSEAGLPDPSVSQRFGVVPRVCNSDQKQKLAALIAEMKMYTITSIFAHKFQRD